MRAAVYARVPATRQVQAQTIEQQLDRLRLAVAGRGDDHGDLRPGLGAGRKRRQLAA